MKGGKVKMALSGSIQTTVNTHWYLRLEWSANQDVTNNRSRVTVNLYWGGTYAVRSTANKTAGIKYNGGSWNTKSDTYLAGINDGDKKLIHSISFYINHNSSGDASFSVDGYFTPEVTLSGTYYGQVDLAEKTFSLNRIEQAGKMWVNTSGGWEKGVAYVYASGAWRKAKSVYVYASGAWRQDSG